MIVNLSQLIYSSFFHNISPLFYNRKSAIFVKLIIEIPEVSQMKHYFEGSIFFSSVTIHYFIYRILMKQNRQKKVTEIWLIKRQIIIITYIYYLHIFRFSISLLYSVYTYERQTIVENRPVRLSIGN
jgi:hypothetical protein